MFRILSDLSLVTRKELPIDTTSNSYHVLTSGISGVWVTLDASGYATRTGTATELAWPIFNDSARDGTVGWTPDVTTSNGVTVLAGKYFAATNQYTSVSAVGPLATGANGKLVTATEGTTTNVVAYCIKAPYTDAFTGLTVIDIFVM